MPARRLLNLNDFAGRALAAIAIGGGALPLGLRLLGWVLGRFGLRLALLEQAARVLFWAGGVCLALLILLVIAEQVQDRVIYRQYLREREKEAGGECPFCGNRQVRPFDSTCRVCGRQLRRRE